MNESMNHETVYRHILMVCYIFFQGESRTPLIQSKVKADCKRAFDENISQNHILAPSTHADSTSIYY